MLEIRNDKQRKAMGDSKNKDLRLKSLEDEVQTVRASIVFTADQHRRYKIYLANKSKKMKDDILEYIESAIKDIP